MSSAAGHLDQAIELFGAKSDAAYPRYLRAKIYGDQRDSAKAVAQLEQAVGVTSRILRRHGPIWERRVRIWGMMRVHWPHSIARWSKARRCGGPDASRLDATRGGPVARRSAASGASRAPRSEESIGTECAAVGVAAGWAERTVPTPSSSNSRHC